MSSGAGLMQEVALLGDLVASLTQGVMLFDTEGSVLLMNPAAGDLLPSGIGWLIGNRRERGAEVFARNGARKLLPTELPLARALRGEATSGLEVLVPGARPPCWVSLSGWPLRGLDGELTAAVLTVIDISERVAAQDLAAEADERVRVVFERAPVGLALADARDFPGRLVQVNAALASLVGIPASELRGQSIESLIHPSDVERAEALLRDLRIERRSAPEHELRLVGPNGASTWVRISSSLVRDARGRAGFAVLQLEDTRQRRRFEERLRYLADHDPLTGLANRRRLQEELAAHQHRCVRFGSTGSLVLLDLDGFKDINDTLGHVTGDQVLRNVSGSLSERLRETDVLARLGGDEFALLLPGTEADAAAELARELLLLLSSSAGTGTGTGTELHLTASAGVAAFAGAPLGGRDVLAEADVALYEAKAAGRGEVARYEPSGQRERAAPRLTWAHRIRDALRDDGFELVAQPIFDLVLGTVTQHELLLRLPDRGALVEPSQFLPLADAFGSMPAIDRWVLRSALVLIGERPELGLLHVNVSAASLEDSSFGDEVDGALSASGADPGRLVLEITETAAISHMERARALADRLRELGCRLALDDFGRGFASFYYLKHLPVDLLKIDGEFVRDLEVSELSRTVVQAIVQVSRSLGRRTIAECVESEAVYELLRTLGVDAAQGWYVGRPMRLQRSSFR